MRAARRLLKPDGLFVVKFAVTSPFIAGRLEEVLTDVFGAEPLQIVAEQARYTSAGRFFIAGSTGRIRQALRDTALASYYGTHHTFATAAVPVTTDDWPCHRAEYGCHGTGHQYRERHSQDDARAHEAK